MIKEKMLELLILQQKIKQIPEICGNIKFFDKVYDTDKMLNRLIELEKEFLEPYVIESDSKE